MCDPQWINLPAGSTLRVSERDNTGVAIRATVTINGGAPTQCPLPLEQTLGAHARCIVFLDMASVAADATATIVSCVEDASGSVIRGPDECEITVQPDETASSQVMAATRSGL